MFIPHPFWFLLIEHDQRFIQIPLVFHEWENILGSIYGHSFFPFVTNHWDMNIWFLIVWIESRFNGSLFYLPLVSHLWDDIVGSVSGDSFFPLVCHHWDAPKPLSKLNYLFL